MSDMHPKALEAKKRQQLKAIEKQQLDNLFKWSEGYADRADIKFWHRMPTPANPIFGTSDMRGMTVAYSVQRRNIIKIATAICHPNDNFSKKMGRAMAAQNFSIGHNIDLHMPAHFNGDVKAFLNATFGD